MVQTCLFEITPPSDASRVQRAVKALKSLAKEKDVQAAVDKIHRDIDVLVLHQTTQHDDTGERILDAVGKLQVHSPRRPHLNTGTTFPSESIPARRWPSMPISDLQLRNPRPRRSQQSVPHARRMSMDD